MKIRSTVTAGAMAVLTSATAMACGGGGFSYCAPTYHSAPKYHTPTYYQAPVYHSQPYHASFAPSYHSAPTHSGYRPTVQSHVPQSTQQSFGNSTLAPTPSTSPGFNQPSASSSGLSGGAPDITTSQLSGNEQLKFENGKLQVFDSNGNFKGNLR